MALPCPLLPVGVGSNRSQPYPWKYSSGQACASWEVTTHSPLDTVVPEVKPKATRDGMPSSRDSTAMAEENCWQYPVLVTVRNLVRPAASTTVGAFSV